MHLFGIVIEMEIFLHSYENENFSIKTSHGFEVF